MAGKWNAIGCVQAARAKNQSARLDSLLGYVKVVRTQISWARPGGNHAISRWPCLHAKRNTTKSAIASGFSLHGLLKSRPNCRGSSPMCCSKPLRCEGSQMVSALPRSRGLSHVLDDFALEQREQTECFLTLGSVATVSQDQKKSDRVHDGTRTAVRKLISRANQLALTSIVLERQCGRAKISHLTTAWKPLDSPDICAWSIFGHPNLRTWPGTDRACNNMPHHFAERSAAEDRPEPQDINQDLCDAQDKLPLTSSEVHILDVLDDCARLE